MKGKTFYLKDYERFIHCHGEQDHYLVFGAMSVFYNDSRTNVLRQQVSKELFERLPKEEILKDYLDIYPFVTFKIFGPPITFQMGAYRVTSKKSEINFLKGAIVLPHEEYLFEIEE